MSGTHEFTVIFHPEPEGGYTVLVPALPEVVTCGETLEEARAMAEEAIALILEAYREEGWPIPVEESATRVERLIIAA